MQTSTENLFQPLSIADAPEAAKPILENVKKGYGFIPNLMATFANSPTVLQGYLAMDTAFERGTFTPLERQLILLSASVVNECSYCAAAHSTVANGSLHAPAEVVSAIRDGRDGPDAKLNALVTLTKEMVEKRGYVEPASINAFLNVGYRKDQVMELLVGVALKTVSNYLDHISPATVDAAFAPESR